MNNSNNNFFYQKFPFWQQVRVFQIPYQISISEQKYASFDLFFP